MFAEGSRGHPVSLATKRESHHAQRFLSVTSTKARCSPVQVEHTHTVYCPRTMSSARCCFFCYTVQVLPSGRSSGGSSDRTSLIEHTILKPWAIVETSRLWTRCNSVMLRRGTARSLAQTGALYRADHDCVEAVDLTARIPQIIEEPPQSTNYSLRPKQPKYLSKGQWLSRISPRYFIRNFTSTLTSSTRIRGSNF